MTRRVAVVIASLSVASTTRAQTAEVAPPTKLWAAQTTLNQITLVWKLAPGASGYVLYRNAGRGNSASGPSAAEGHAKVAALAGNVSRYVYVVRSALQDVQQFYLEATDANGHASAKVAFNPVTVVTTPVAAVQPGSVSAKESAAGVITVTWTPSPGATAYALGRIAGPYGWASLCAICPTEPSYVDSGVTNGTRYQYSVAAITPTAISLRTISNVITPGVVATGGGTTGTGGSGTGGGTGGTSGTGDTTRAGDTTHTTTVLHGRYRVTLTGFTVQSQTYDNPLQIDGKGDEVFLATQVMVFDTASASLVVANDVKTSRIHGDINGFSYRVKAGTASLMGGLVTGNTFPVAGTTAKSAGDLPTILWEGELIQNRSAVVIVPTVWEWDNNPELFGNWLTGRHAMLARLLQPEPIAATLVNRDPTPIEIGSGGMFIRTNMFGDARDRPIGLKPGAPASGPGFYGPLPLDPKTGTSTTSYAANSGSIVSAILGSSPLTDYSTTLIDRLFQVASSFGSTLGTTNARVPLASGSNLPGAIGGLVSGIRTQISNVLRSQPAIGLRQFLNVLTMASPSSFSTDLYFFEKMVVLTPQSIQAALSQSKTTGGAVINVQYADYGSLAGKYTLHLKVEQLP